MFPCAFIYAAQEFSEGKNPEYIKLTTFSPSDFSPAGVSGAKTKNRENSKNRISVIYFGSRKQKPTTVSAEKTLRRRSMRRDKSRTVAASGISDRNYP